MVSRLKSWLVIGLLVSNLAVGLLSLFYLNSINGRYESLLDSHVPVINRLRTLTRELGLVQRYARRITDESAPAGRLALADEMDAISNNARAQAEQLSRHELFRETVHAKRLAAFSQDYDDKADHYLALVRDGKREEAARYNAEVMRATYDAYQTAIDVAANGVLQQGMDERARYEQESRWFNRLLLAFAGWPLFAAILLTVPVAVVFVLLAIAIVAPALGVRRNYDPPAA
ncbi:MAG TPA: MCP four helix bundle domain-containing protein [Candidatus Didemnitutus sp.]